MNKSFKILMEILKSIIKIMNENDYRIRNKDDEDFYISDIYYDPEDDRIYFYCNDDVI